MLSPSSPYLYYISFLGPACLVLLLSLICFIMIIRVLSASPLPTVKLTPQRKNSVLGYSSSVQTVVSLTQVRGTFTVMVLLSVPWIFGGFTAGEKYYQYVLGICNFLHGFMIFVARCLCNSEARDAWKQLMHTGTLKKYCGVIPPDTLPRDETNAHRMRSKHSKGNESFTNGIFSLWINNSRLSQALRNSFAEADAGWNTPCLNFAPLTSSVQSILSEAPVSKLVRMSNPNNLEDDDQDTQNKTVVKSYIRPVTLSLGNEKDISSQSSGCTRTSNLSDESPNCRFCGRIGCKAEDHSQCFVTELSYVTV